MSKKEYGQFFTTNAEYILDGMLGVFDNGKKVIEPFAGNLDLLFSIKSDEMYDIEPRKKNIIKRDTLLFPPDYANKMVLTNPPYLARNKAKDKTIFDKYKVNDLYKAFLLSALEMSGGVIIIPVNFFCDEDFEVRNKFLSIFKILKVKIFEEVVFDDTDTQICAISFIREENSEQNVKFIFSPSKKELEINLSKENGYKINPFGNLKNENIVSRLMLKDNKNKTHIFLNAVDTGSPDGRIRLSYRDNYYFGKMTDRAFATLCINIPLTQKQEYDIINEFNRILEEERERYNSLFLTGFRNSTKNYSRKRISFDVVYRIVEKIIKEKIL